MSLLGFDAVGRFALGQLPEKAITFTLNISAGSFTITGNPVTFTIKEAISAASLSISGTATPLNVSESIAAGSFAIGGSPIAFTVEQNPASYAFSITGNPVNETVLETEGPASYQITPVDTPLHRTGDDYEFKLGGVGHFKMEMEEARRLAAITRRGPPGFLDLRSQPTATPFGGSQIAPQSPAPDLSAIAAQAAQAQRAAKQRRDIEAILLLAA